MQIILGLLIISAGAFMVVKTESMLSGFGRIAFFEQYLGTEGGSRLGYKLLGLLFIFIGTLIFTGMISGFLEWLLSPILRYSRNIN